MSDARHTELPMLAIFADESCLGNGREGSNPGGAAGVVEYWNAATERLTRFDYWVSEPATTNNRMALRSVIEAFRAISRKGTRFRVVFTTDSQYLVKGMTEWVHGWNARGWKRKGRHDRESRVVACRRRPKRLATWWNGDGFVAMSGTRRTSTRTFSPYGRRASKRRQTASSRPASTQWLEAERAKGRMAAEPDPFPVAAPVSTGPRLASRDQSFTHVVIRGNVSESKYEAPYRGSAAWNGRRILAGFWRRQARAETTWQSEC